MQGKSILVRVSEGSSYRESTVQFSSTFQLTSCYIVVAVSHNCGIHSNVIVS